MYHDRKVYQGVQAEVNAFITWAPDGSKWPVPGTGCFIPEEINPC